VKKKPARVKTKPKVTVVNSSTVRRATYSNKDARDAYDEYRRGQLDPTVSISYKGIQEKYGIPKSVMSKLLTGKRALDRVGSGGGPMPHLTPVEERGVVLAADRSNRNGVKCLSKEAMGATQGEISRAFSEITRLVMYFQNEILTETDLVRRAKVL
jgi:hypothetical protein